MARRQIRTKREDRNKSEYVCNSGAERLNYPNFVAEGGLCNSFERK